MSHSAEGAMDRLFVAVHLPSEVSTRIQDWTETLREQVNFKKWVHPQDYHITLQFLGDTPSNRIAELTAALQEVAKEHKPFRLGLYDAGVFGASASPRILWAGVGGDLNALSQLQQSVVSRMEAFGFVPEERPFRPHITIGRKFQGNQKFSLDVIGTGPKPIQWEVQQLVLFRTNLHASPMYETVGVARLSTFF
ncbi:RNA 2',3'-cyclic phosphodiesterase [Paenibacillus sp. NPDC058910]|uniref:RNA 2',3'-cyclic phosphodiesterase n=1 Tax=unclassified Paenibacillus TaxID=185978 RepID=UPI0036B0DE55